MSDLYHIPNDDGKTYRLRKFVEYQHEVPSIHYRFLGEWVKKNCLCKEEALDMCWLMSVTYSELTCILIFELLKKHSTVEIWTKYKKKLNFGSARKHAKNNDLFVPLMEGWKGVKLDDCVTEDPALTYRNFYARVSRLKNVGRFAADLFMEMIVYLAGYLGISAKEPLLIDWKNCANLTSGIYNIFYEDERANEFDRTKKVSKEERLFLTRKLMLIQEEIKKTYPTQDADISMFIGKICSFRNLFKNARYGGFHHDRQLGVLRQYEKDFPEYSVIWGRCYGLRKEIFPHRFLGELNGWSGIRKERKKLWLTTGETGAEIDFSMKN